MDLLRFFFVKKLTVPCLVMKLRGVQVALRLPRRADLYIGNTLETLACAFSAMLAHTSGRSTL